MLEKLWDYFRLARPSYWVLVMVMVYVGIIIGINELPTDWMKVVRIFMLSIVFSSSAFSLNQVFDAELDKKTTRHTDFGPIRNSTLPIATGKISPKNGLIFSTILAFLSLLISTTFSLNVAYIIAILLLLHVLYSAPPVRLKVRTPFDAITNALGFGVLSPLLGVFAFNAFAVLNLELLLILTICFILAFGIYIPTTIADYDFDKKFGLNTFAVRFGIKKAAKISAIIQLFGIGLSFLLLSINNFPKIVFSLLPFTLILLISTLVIYKSPSSRTTILVYSPALLTTVVGIPIMITIATILF